MSRQVPIRYRAEPLGSDGKVVQASSGECVAHCWDYANAVMIADALNKANGVGPTPIAGRLVERIERLEERVFPASPMKGGVIFPDEEDGA